MPRKGLDELPAKGIIAEPLDAYSPRVVANAISHKELWERAVCTTASVTEYTRPENFTPWPSEH
jgi:hypothetical protein